MKMRWPARLAALVFALPVPAAAAAGIEIRHTPVECVPRDRYARIAASASPAERVAASELQFRASGNGPWYSVGMAAEGGEWSAVVPRPTGALERFQYRVVMRSADLETSETAPFAVRVGDDCVGTGSSVAVEAPIVVRVPAGAPVVPPVPPGFSPAGVVAAEDLVPKPSATKKWIALAGVAGGVAAAAVAAGSRTGMAPSREVPAFEFLGTVPAPGSVIFLSSDSFSVFVRVSGGSRPSLYFVWRLDLLAAGGRACIVTGGAVTIDPQRPQVVPLYSRLLPFTPCGPSFDVETGRLTILLDDQNAYDQTFTLPYHFEP